MRSSHARAVLSSVLLVIAATGTAWANGRFPITTNIELHPSDPDTHLAPATFGLLITTDGGATYHWVCEAALGYGGTYDPDYALAADGSIYITSFGGLRVSRDGGCTYQPVAGAIGTVLAGSVEIAANGDVWANASAPTNNGVYRSTDNGATFARTALEVPFAFWRRLRIAPSSSTRVYITGYFIPGAVPDAGPGEGPALLYRTDDAGSTWTELSTAGFAFGAEALLDIEAISPTDPDVVYARVVRATAPNGDALYRSTDAGATWVKILDTSDTITTVVARADGTTLLVGTRFDTPAVQISSDRGDTWSAPPAQPQMACAGERFDGVLFACGANWEPDCMALARSATGQTWQSILEFQALAGPLACEPGTEQHDTCAAEQWPLLAMQLGVGGERCAAGGDAGPIDASVGIDARASIADAAPDASAGGNSNGDGCGCSVALASLVLVPPFGRRRQRAKQRRRGRR